MLNHYIEFPIFAFFTNVIIKSLLVIIISTAISYVIYTLIPFSALPRLILTSVESWAMATLIIYYIGLNKAERDMVVRMFKMLKKIMR